MPRTYDRETPRRIATLKQILVDLGDIDLSALESLLEHYSESEESRRANRDAIIDLQLAIHAARVNAGLEDENDG